MTEKREETPQPPSAEDALEVAEREDIAIEPAGAGLPTEKKEGAAYDLKSEGLPDPKSGSGT